MTTPHLHDTVPAACGLPPLSPSQRSRMRAIEDDILRKDREARRPHPDDQRRSLAELDAVLAMLDGGGVTADTPEHAYMTQVLDGLAERLRGYWPAADPSYLRATVREVKAIINPSVRIVR